jgi:acyl transferase domain-containing protein
MSHDRSRCQIPVAVVGLGVLIPGATDIEECWRLMVEGRDQITDVPPTRWLVEDYYDPDPSAPDKTYACRGAFLPEVDFDPMAFGILPNALPATDTAQLLALLVAEQVLAELGEAGRSGLDRERVSVILGSAALELVGESSSRLLRPIWIKVLRESGVPEPQAQDICDRAVSHSPPWQEATFPGMLSNLVAGRIAHRFDLHGTNHTTDAACASSLAALSTALDELILGRSDLVITGGVDTLNNAFTFVCFSKTPALSLTGDCRPFSDRADGTMLGEGLVMFALKRLADAERDGDRIYAVIRGLGASSDGRSTAIYAPAPEGQARALRRAYETAGYSPDTVELVEAHGTATPAGDHAEFTALRQVFAESGRDDRQWCALGSIKSQLGHTKCAAGAVGLLKAVLALHHNILPPTIKVDRPNPELDLDNSPFYLNTHARPWVHPADHPRRASVSSFGFGGSNFHVTVEQYVPSHGSAGRQAWRCRTAPTELVLFSADSPEALLAQGHRVDLGRRIADIARESQREFRATGHARLAVVAVDTADLTVKLAEAAALIEQRPEVSFSTPTGICYAAGRAISGQVGFLFPGQGAQYVGMSADVAMHLPLALAVWDRVGAHDFGDDLLHRVVFPPPVFTDEARAAQQARLTATEWAQPALAAHSLALLEVLQGLGLEPDCVAGHSLGELVALCAADAFDMDGLVRLARKRGELMRDAATVPGAMLAVAATREHVEAVLASCGAPGVWLANHNAPQQVVVSGDIETLDTVAATFAANGIATRQLNVATAFHSPLVALAGKPLLDVLRGVEIRGPRIDVYGNADAAVFPTDPDEMRRRIADHLASPVWFADEIEAMYAAGVRTFVEVGAGATLTGLVRQILGEREHVAVSLDRQGRNGVTSLQEGLGQLAVGGFDLNFDVLWESYAPAVTRGAKRQSEMTVKIDGGNYGRRYPPAGGARELPPPHPPAPHALPATATQPAPAVTNGSATSPRELAMPAAVSPDSSAVDAGWLRIIEDAQRQTAEAHTDYQRLLTESHMAFLKMSEATLVGMLGALGGEAPAPATLSLPLMPDAAPADQVEHMTPPPVASMVPDQGVRSLADLSGEAIERLLLSVVAERTGYPVEILHIDMELDADLGIDSIKKVEILAALREQFGAEVPIGQLRQEDVIEFGKLRTLRQIVDKFLEHREHTLTPASPVTTQDAPADLDKPQLSRLAMRAVATPAPGRAMTGLSDGPVVVTQDGAGIAPLIVARLVEHGVPAVLVDSVPSDARGVVFLGGLADVGSVDQALAVQWEAFRAARTVAAHLTDHGGVFVTVQDTGGDFGLGGRQSTRAWLGGLAALARTAAKEWPHASVKAIDCEQAGREPEAVAEVIVAELCGGGSALDVGLRADGTRYTLQAVPAPVGDDNVAQISSESVIVATGGARGVTAAALLALARARQPRLVLLGRTLLAEEPEGLSNATDEPSLTRILAEQEQQRTGNTPALSEITAEARRILTSREVRSTLEQLERAGSSVRYLPIDVRDTVALTAALDKVRREWGPITGIVHAAGVLADKRITDKTDEQFQRVFDTKVAGLRALLEATADDPLNVICLFSSVAACFGNLGQCDYAMANEVLDQVASVEQVRRPWCLVRSIAWGPWKGGMVTPSLVEFFSRIGIPLIPIEAGADAFVAELTSSATDTRVVIATSESIHVLSGTVV